VDEDDLYETSILESKEKYLDRKGREGEAMVAYSENSVPNYIRGKDLNPSNPVTGLE